jgi:hypothetical protein
MFLLALATVSGACTDRGVNTPEARDVMHVTRAWLSALNARDTARLNSLSAQNVGARAARNMEARGSAFVRAFAAPTARVEVLSVTGDSAFATVRPERFVRESPIAIILVHDTVGWRVANAAQLRRD